MQPPVKAQASRLVSVDAIAATAAVTSAVSGVVGAIVAAVVASVRTKSRKAIDQDKAMRDGMRALLWRELKNIHAEAMANGGMTVANRRHLENVYGAYHGIGGNGTGTRMFDDSMQTPVIDE